jgi:hypothetical protein
MKKKIVSRWLRGACAGIFLGTGALLFSGCEATVSTPDAEGYYDYNYYPAENVYYYPQGRIYYWNEDGEWRSGRALPPTVVIHEEHYEHYRSHSTQPWMERHEGEGRAGEIRHDRGDDYRDRDDHHDND